MAFATHSDVATRLGRDLTVTEQATAEAVIETVTGLIVDAVSKTDAWAAALDPVPTPLKALCVEKAKEAIVNPYGVASTSEQVGSYQHSETYPRSSDIGIFLSEIEERRARRAVWGTNSGSVHIDSILAECGS